jgi:tryptophan synthase alpha chain
MNNFSTTSKQIGLFVTAGFPELDSTNSWIQQIDQAGYDFLEIGMPFSDPLADGLVIQHSSDIALKNGMNLDVLFKQLSERDSSIQIPLVLMGYLNPVLQYGLERFLTRCNEVGVKHVILPDMSVEIYERFYHETFYKFGVKNCFLITTITPEHILDKVKKYGEGTFVYLVSSNATTGSQGEFVLNETDKIAKIKGYLGNIPLFIGFGIKKQTDVKQVFEHADGAIVGSAFLQAIERGEADRFLSELNPSSKVEYKSL